MMMVSSVNVGENNVYVTIRRIQLANNNKLFASIDVRVTIEVDFVSNFFYSQQQSVWR